MDFAALLAELPKIAKSAYMDAHGERGICTEGQNKEFIVDEDEDFWKKMK